MSAIPTRTLGTGLVFGLLASLLGACAPADAERSAGVQSDQDWLRIVPVFGDAREDISADVEWFGAQVGVVEREITSSVSGRLTGFSFRERLRSPADDNVFPVGEGDIGVVLNLGGAELISRQPAPPVVGGWQVLEIPATGLARTRLTVTGLAPDARVDIDIETPSGGIALGASPTQRNLYTPPGALRITVTEPGSGQRRSHALEVDEGQTKALDVAF